jgi:hypothetical protein
MRMFADGKDGAEACARIGAWGLFLLVLTTLCLAAPRRAAAQAAESADAGSARLAVGGGGSGFTLGYGNRRMLAATGWVDGDTIRRFGFEGEAHWVDFHQTANVHAETYLGGLRYHFNVGRTQPYLKALSGLGHFNFPYNYATGRYFVVAGGGGLDYKLNRRWIVRTDFEYQDWPQFTYGAMNSLGVTVGVRFRVF